MLSRAVLPQLAPVRMRVEHTRNVRGPSSNRHLRFAWALLRPRQGAWTAQDNVSLLDRFRPDVDNLLIARGTCGKQLVRPRSHSEAAYI